MSNVSKVVSLRDAKSDFKMLLVLVFCLVAMSFFAVGFIYAQAPDTSILVSLLVLAGIINTGMLYYVVNKFNAISNT
ncbi:MAG TPA: hypothetical protein VLA40_04745 [Rheinheimera sp.]|nr:hypothetical protein [Rheinheimera sp.]